MQTKAFSERRSIETEIKGGRTLLDRLVHEALLVEKIVNGSVHELQCRLVLHLNHKKWELENKKHHSNCMFGTSRTTPNTREAAASFSPNSAKRRTWSGRSVGISELKWRKVIKALYLFVLSVR